MPPTKDPRVGLEYLFAHSYTHDVPDIGASSAAGTWVDAAAYRPKGATRDPDLRLDKNGSLSAVMYRTKVGDIVLHDLDGPWTFLRSPEGKWHSVLDMARAPPKKRAGLDPQLESVLQAVTRAYNHPGEANYASIYETVSGLERLAPQAPQGWKAG